LSKVFFITGVSSGIGKAISFQLIHHGHRVYGVARREPKLIELQKELKASSDNFAFNIGDVTDDTFMNDSLSKAIEKFGKIDVLIPNAGYSRKDNFNDMTYKDYSDQIDVNLLSIIRLLYKAKDELQKNNGQIIFISSFFDQIYLPTFSAYIMSKSALSMFAKSTYEDFKSIGINTSLIIPGFTKSDIRARNKLGIYQDELDRKTFSFLEMETDTVAKKIINTINKKSRYKVIGVHTRLLLIGFKYFGFILYPIISRLYSKKISLA